MITRIANSEIAELLAHFPAVMLYGPRQIGKTTLAKQLGAYTGKKVHYFDLEKERDLLPFKTNAADYLASMENDLVIIDEVQTYPPLFSALRGIIDSNRSAGRFVLLGSADPSLVKGVSESLAGRVIYKEITQIGLLEVSNSGIALAQHWFRGGFPEALLVKNDTIWDAWVDSFIQSYVYRDLNTFFGINLSPALTLRLWNMLAHLNSDIENMEDIGRSLGITGTSAKKYIDYMQGAYLIRRLAPWHHNGGKRLIKSPKLYVRTSAILHHLLHLQNYQQLQSHPAVGASWEAYVIEQIYTYLPKGLQMYFYRTHHGAEVDLLLVKGVSPLASIEIKLSDFPSIQRGFYECVEDLGTIHNYIITPNAIDTITNQDIRITSLLNFLKNELPNL